MYNVSKERFCVLGYSLKLTLISSQGNKKDGFVIRGFPCNEEVMWLKREQCCNTMLLCSVGIHDGTFKI